MGLPILTLVNPPDSSSTASPTPTLSVLYEDPVDYVDANITLEVDRIGTFNTSYYQTQTVIAVTSGTTKDFTVATPLSSGFWYWRVIATNTDGTTVSETMAIKVELGAVKRTLYQYENITKYNDWKNKRTLYQYENIAKYGPDFSNKRALYQYETITDDPPFPYIRSLSSTRAETGSVITISGNGFGKTDANDPDNPDRALRGYGGFVYIGATLCNVLSWSWTEIEFQIPDSAQSGAVKVVLTVPTVRESNVIGLEVVQKFAEETGLELYVCDRSNPNKVVAYLESATDKTFQLLMNNPGSGQLTISRLDADGGNRDLIRDQNLILCKIGGRSIFKWIIESRNPQYVDSGEQQLIKVSGRGVLSILETAVVYPEGMPTPESLEREFVGVRGAAILRQLITEAKSRGALVGIELDFTADEDSIGNPWTDSTSISFHAGTPLLEVANRLGEGMGLFDYELTPDLKLKLYRSKGTNKYEEVRYRPSQAIITHQNQSDASKVTNTVLVEGEGGAIVEAVHAEGQISWGRREGYLQARNIKSEWSALQSYGNSFLATAAYAAWGIQGTVTDFLDDSGERLAPFKSYELGDWIGWLIPPEGTDEIGFDGRLRVKGITCQEDNDTGHLKYTLELNNVMLEHDIRIAQLVDRMAQFSRSTTLTSPSTEVSAPLAHNHVHGLLNNLDEDDHPQYYNLARHAADLHESVPRVSSIRADGEDELTGAVEIAAGVNVSVTQETLNKQIMISAGINSGISLPTPIEELRGQMFFLEGNVGISDQAYICIKDSSDNYTWLTL
ncbi:hypothetical protein EAL2_c06010 [Peptoclostridium acidaminophilum DSM 3953]|uniref:IPT/TIG domain-containing protein n=1 Tax=Peptoclostridium acidaminophilum DSM 3953 TaxID=1286171 RepID=W8TDK1_PEPAC|nr:IPT/TIG domain-containing protein [Peptoclostridium acidaminophilum]AHM55903.1 hypothetical protein EAL2_c06010 [Peptoclostridium acidaminophilum DSM 3953]